MFHNSTGDYNLASQHGMTMGSVRHGADMKTDQPDMKGQGVLSKQTGMLWQRYIVMQVRAINNWASTCLFCSQNTVVL